MTTKICGKCHHELSLDNFHKNKTRPDGLSIYCKSCSKIMRDEFKERCKDNQKIVTEKPCSKCGIIKPIDCFDKTNRSKDGHVSECKACKAERHKNTYPARKEHILNYLREYNSKNKEKRREYRKQWYIDRYDKLQKYYKEYREKNRDIMRIRMDRYYRTPKGRMASTRGFHKRRSRERNNVCNLTAEQWDAILKAQNNRCAICGKKFCKSRPPTKDHIIPLSKGGGLTYENVQALCQSCNSKKGTKIDKSLIVSYGIYDEKILEPC